MNLAEFDALCEREWEKNKGDISVLRLTDASADELERELLLNSERLGPILYVRTDQVPGEGPLFTHIENPITRTPVEIDRGYDRDVAEIYYVVRLDNGSEEV